MKALPIPQHKLGKLLPLSFFQQTGKELEILCVCDCGTLCTISRYDLMRRHGSCGCTRRRHSHTYRNGVKQNTREYNSWRSMKERCNNPNSASWPNYGARGISYDPRWELFTNFFTDMGSRPLGTSLNRLNVNLDYSPGNCNWATQEEQNNPENKRTGHEWDWEIHAEAVAS